MPRKPRTRARRSHDSVSADPPPTSLGAQASRKGGKEIFWQCQACGGLVDPMYGLGDDSWCPHCHAVGRVFGMEDQIPSPVMYGSWVAKQQQAAERKRTKEEIRQRLSALHTPKGDPTMKRKKTHTGTFHCPKCFIEFDVVAEESLKCDQCGGPLAKGTLDQVWADEDDVEGDDEND